VENIPAAIIAFVLALYLRASAYLQHAVRSDWLPECRLHGENRLKYVYGMVYSDRACPVPRPLRLFLLCNLQAWACSPTACIKCQLLVYQSANQAGKSAKITSLTFLSSRKLSSKLNIEIRQLRHHSM
jgi:hypothetical protein